MRTYWSAEGDGLALEDGDSVELGTIDGNAEGEGEDGGGVTWGVSTTTDGTERGGAVG